MSVSGYSMHSLYYLVLCSMSVLAAVSCEELRIAWLAPKKFVYAFNASSSMGALVAAINRTANDPALLPNITSFNVTWRDSDCNSKIATGVIYETLLSGFNPHVIIGPACTNAMEPVAQLGSIQNIPVFGWISSDSPLRDKQVYTTLVRFLRDVKTLGEGLVQFFRMIGWKRVFIISTKGEENEIGTGVRSAFLSRSAEGYVVARWESDVNRGADSDTIRAYYRNVKREARIVALCVPDDEVRKWMLAAYDEGMTDGDYVFIFLTQFYPDEVKYSEVTNRSYWEKGDGRDEEARKAFANLFYFTSKTLSFSDVRKYQKEFNEAGNTMPWPSILMPPTKSDFYSLFLYDAMMTYAITATEANTINDGKKIFQTCTDRIFEGGATGSIILDSKAERIPDFWVFDLGADGRFALAAETSGKRGANGTVEQDFIEVKAFRWGNGKTGLMNAPPDTPECGFENELCPYETWVIVVPCVIVGVLLVTAVLLFFVLRKVMYERSLKSMHWRINWDDMAIYTGMQPFGSQLNFRTLSQNLRKSRSGLDAGSESMDSKAEEAQVFATVANYKGGMVAIKRVRKDKLKIDRDFLLEMKMISELKHSNLTTFVGACITAPNISAVWEYCSKGSLQDVIWNETVSLDDMFKYSIVIDILKGIVYLHSTSVRCHGNLKSSNVVIDGRWSCKLTDFGLTKLLEGQEEDPERSDYAKYSAQFWCAPEILRAQDSQSLPKGDARQPADLYSVGIIIKETFARNGPYSEHDEDMSPEEIISRVKNPSERMRPALTDEAIPKGIVPLVESCYHEQPHLRPTAQILVKSINRINPNKNRSVMDNMIVMMEKYSNHLEEIVAERTLQLEEEKKKTEMLLYRMLPQSVAEDLKHGKTIQAESFEAVSIYFSDIVKFTNLAGESTPLQVVDLLSALYTLFDETIKRHDVYKVETIGDAYMFVSGVPIRNGDRHTVEITNCAMDLLSGVMNFKVPHKPDYNLRVRIGLHTGKCVAGVVGLTMPRYCLFGDTVNVASKMESGGSPMRIHLSESVYEGLSKFSGYFLAERGSLEIKGKGHMKTYWVVGRENFERPFPDFDELAAEDNPRPLKLPVTVGKSITPKGGRPSAESGFCETINVSKEESRAGAVPEIKVLPPVENTTDKS